MLAEHSAHTFGERRYGYVRRKLLALQYLLRHLERNLNGHQVAADVFVLERLPLAAASQPVLVLEVQKSLCLVAGGADIIRKAGREQRHGNVAALLMAA